jgi:hypothetical protein
MVPAINALIACEAQRAYQEGVEEGGRVRGRRGRKEMGNRNENRTLEQDLKDKLTSFIRIKFARSCW